MEEEMSIFDKNQSVSGIKLKGESTGESSCCFNSLSEKELEKRIIKKLDLYVMPVIMIMYIVSFLDRANIGNAKIAGMATDLNLTGTNFNVATSIFYVPYIIFDVPMTILVKRLGPSYVLPTITLAWGFVALFSGFVTSYGSLLVVRLLLGLCEAGLFPGLNFYISTLYKRTEISKRVCMIFVAMALSGAFGGLLAYAILMMDGVGGKAGWRWLFIIEGLGSLVVGVVCYFALPNSCGTAYFLSLEERLFALSRLTSEINFNTNDMDNKVKWREAKEAFCSINVWISGLIQLGADIYLFGFSIFLPTIVESMGYNSVEAQYLTIPVYLTGAICYFIVSFFADRYQRWFIFMVTAGLFVFAGYAILLASTTMGVLYMATFLIASGGFIVPGLNITWLSVNTAGTYKRATAIGINQSIGNLGGVIAGQIYLTQDAPRYIPGHATSIGGMCLAFICTIVLFLIFRHKNKKKQQRLVGIGESFNDKTGDESPHFYYVM